MPTAAGTPPAGGPPGPGGAITTGAPAGAATDESPSLLI